MKSQESQRDCTRNFPNTMKTCPRHTLTKNAEYTFSVNQSCHKITWKIKSIRCGCQSRIGRILLFRCPCLLLLPFSTLCNVPCTRLPFSNHVVCLPRYRLPLRQ